MRKRKSIISLFLVFLLSMMPVVANAAEMSSKSIQPDATGIAIAYANKETGPWFGDVKNNFKVHINSGKENQTQGRILAVLLSTASAFLPNEYAQGLCAGLATTLAFAEDDGHPAKDYYGTTTKRYREVKISGEFAYFETMITITIYSDSARRHQIAMESDIYEGQLMMNE